MSTGEEFITTTGENTQKLMDVGSTDPSKISVDSNVENAAEYTGDQLKDGLGDGSNLMDLTGNGDNPNSDSIGLPDPTYMTNFCKNRNFPQDKGVLDIVDGLESILNIPQTLQDSLGTAILGIFLILYLIWILMKYYDLLIPFAGGAFNILKFLLIYTIVITLLVFFFKFTAFFGFWYVLFVKFFKLMMNPLLDENVSFLYCYLTDYVNWMIYFPAMFFYFICLVGITLLLFLIILPLLAIVSFAISWLFSLIGSPPKTGEPGAVPAPSVVSKMSQTASALMSKIPMMGRFAK